MKCPYHTDAGVYLVGNKGVIHCKGKGNHKMLRSQADTVREKFCNGNYQECNYFKQYEEEKSMEQNQIPQEEMNNMVQAGIKTAMSEEFKKAYTVHLSIKQNGETAATALTEMCKSLKQMRDEKLYTELGFDTFENYVENNGDYSFKARQAYTYISTYEKLGSILLQSNANAGITKLSLLAELPGYEREDFTQEHDLETESVSRLKAEIEKLKPKAEQCSMFEKRADDAEAELEKTKTELETIEDEILKKATEDNRDMSNQLANAERELAELKAENKELKDKPIDVAVEKPSEEDIAKIKADLEKEIYEKADKDWLENQKKIEQEYEQKLQAEREKSDKEKADLEKKIKAGTTEESKVAFKFYFDDVQTSLKKFVDLIEKIEDAELKAKFQGAVKKYLEEIKESL